MGRSKPIPAPSGHALLLLCLSTLWVNGQSSRPDCTPDIPNVTKDECVRRKCSYDTSATPECYLTLSYAKNFETSTSRGSRTFLSPSTEPPFGSAFLDAYMEVEGLNNRVLRIKFDDRGSNRYNVPFVVNIDDRTVQDPVYAVKVTSEKPFTFTVQRKATSTIIWDTSVGGLVLSDQFLEISTILPSQNIYGFGDNSHNTFRHVLNKTWSIFNTELPRIHKDGSNINYGSHPFYVCVEDDTGRAHGVLLLNSNAMEIALTSTPTLTYRAIGGVLDFFFFFGDSVEEVAQLYHQFVGLPVMPPYWALGFHVSRHGYGSMAKLKDTVNRLEQSNIPLDVVHIDRELTSGATTMNDEKREFPVLNDYLQDLQKRGIRIMEYSEPTVPITADDNSLYAALRLVDGFIKWPRDLSPPINSSDYYGNILGNGFQNEQMVYVDFFNPKVDKVWTNGILSRRSHLTFDGLSLVMNEPTNDLTNLRVNRCPQNKYDDPPYRTKAVSGRDTPQLKARLSDRTLCMTAMLGYTSQYRFYDVHHMYPLQQSQATLQAIRQVIQKRGLVMSRSTFPGIGQFAGHWLGDNNSEWPDLRKSIIGMMEFNLFGIPLVGADVCGNHGDATEELCMRWTQLGAFYPYFRNHNDIKRLDQDPASFGPYFARASREIIEIRYWLMPHLYTLFHGVHTRGGTVVRSLTHEFPADPRTLDIDYQFMWGSAILISPLVWKNQTSLTYYLPDETWYDLYTGKSMNGSQTLTMKPVTLYTKPALSIRGGHIVPMQRPHRNTQASRNNPLKLSVALDTTGRADGSLFWDDGESTDTYNTGSYLMAEYKAYDHSLIMATTHDGYSPARSLYYDSIDILGVTDDPGPLLVIVDGARESYFVQEYDPRSQKLQISRAKFPVGSHVVISWTPLPDDILTRIDCWPERLGRFDPPDQSKCSQRHCVWNPHPHPDVPPCFFPQTDYGYKLLKTDLDLSEDYVTKAVLSRKGKGPFGHDFPLIEFRLQEYGDDILRFNFDTVSHSRFVPPIPLHLPPRGSTNQRQYSLNVTNADPFTFQILRAATGEVIWDTSAGGLVFDDQFIQISTYPPSRDLYGIGENTKNSFRRDFMYKTYPIFARDQGATASETLRYPKPQYGTHPFYVCMEKSNNAHGVLFVNTAPQDYTLSPKPMITYRSIGGRLDFLVFMGPKPENVVQQYHQVIGKPIMPPYWGLGFALSKYGYGTLDNMKTVVDRTRKANIPVDILYGDIDHFAQRRDFTYDKVRFQGMPEYFQQLRDEGMRTVIILDPAIVSNFTDYNPYARLSDVDGNVHWPDDLKGIPPDSKDQNNSMLGWVWPPGKVVFPDFFKNATVEVWAELIQDYHKTLPFDALWIDMNEPTSFGTNEERAFNWPLKDKPYWTLKCPTSKYDDPPYRTGGSYFYDTATRKGRLSDKTICLSATQGENNEIRNYDVHNMYGHSQALATKIALERTLVGERSFIVSRSTVFGSGHTTTHWLGDNYSGWDDLRVSIVGLLDFNLFGIPFVGADICGHFGNVTVELCKRWMQLGAFYGFCRNHNAIGNREQDPASFDDEMTRMSREAMETRYWLLPYLYTLYHRVHQEGGTVLRPLHHEFVDDLEARSISTQFLWGDSLLISPLLDREEEVMSTYHYLPGPASWYNFYTGQIVSTTGCEWRSDSVRPDTRIPLHVRGGSIIPMQRPALNTTYSRHNKFSLVVALDKSLDGHAEGQVFWDDGNSAETYESGNSLQVTYSFDGNVLTVIVSHNGLATQSSYLLYETVEFWGVAYNEIRTAPYIVTDKNDRVPLKFSYDSFNQVLRVTPERIHLSQDFYISWV